eukprot:370819-Amphidinium_carterae.1
MACGKQVDAQAVMMARVQVMGVCPTAQCTQWRLWTSTRTEQILRVSADLKADRNLEYFDRCAEVGAEQETVPQWLTRIWSLLRGRVTKCIQKPN